MSANDGTRFPSQGVYGLSPNCNWDQTCGMPSPSLASGTSDGERRKGQSWEEGNMAGRELKEPEKSAYPSRGSEWD